LVIFRETDILGFVQRKVKARGYIPIMKALMEKDSEKTGKINAADLKSTLNECGVEIDENEIEILFQNIDKHRSGEIDYRNLIKSLNVIIFQKRLGKHK
jgi:Ca2+-binding EF-hand superfamily protein